MDNLSMMLLTQPNENNRLVALAGLFLLGILTGWLLRRGRRIKRRSPPPQHRPPALWIQAKELSAGAQRMEEELEEMRGDYAEVRATLMVNFGPDGVVAKGVVGPGQRINNMIYKVFTYYQNQLRP